MKITELFRRNAETLRGTTVDSEKAAAQKSQQAPAADETGSVDKVSISPEYAKFRELVKFSQEMDDDSAERVRRIKDKIDSGTYQMPSSEEVARSILSYTAEASGGTKEPV